MKNIDLAALIALRKRLHSLPEVSGNEKNTAAMIESALRPTQPAQLMTQLGGHGLMAVYDSGIAGPCVLLRADIDALPIAEENDFDYKSKHKGVSHKCGHDGHSTILLGVAQRLYSAPPKSGKVALLWQPAEENGMGAAAVMADERWPLIQPDYVFALHNLPGFPAGQIVVKDQTFTAAVNSIILYLKGKTSHAAEPENGINPAKALAELIEKSLALAYNEPDSDAMRVVSIVYAELGEKAYGISAGNASLHLTLRCWNDEQLRLLEADIVQLAQEVAHKEHLALDWEYTQSFHANQNDEAAVAVVKKAATHAKLDTYVKPRPFKWGEDFGLFTARYRGCMFGLGAGENLPALHNPDYDFPDEILTPGIAVFSEIIHQILNQEDV